MTSPTEVDRPGGVTQAMLADVAGIAVAPDVAARIKARVLARIGAEPAAAEGGAPVLDPLVAAAPVAPAGAAKATAAARAQAPHVQASGGKPGFIDILAGAGWQAFAPGVEAKILFEDGFTRSWMVRLHAGAQLPPHEHDVGAEECLVLEGEVWLGDQLYGPGDYQLAHRGTWHATVRSDRGCVMFVRSQLAAAPAP